MKKNAKHFIVQKWSTNTRIGKIKKRERRWERYEEWNTIENRMRMNEVLVVLRYKMDSYSDQSEWWFLESMFIPSQERIIAEYPIIYYTISSEGHYSHKTISKSSIPLSNCWVSCKATWSSL